MENTDSFACLWVELQFYFCGKLAKFAHVIMVLQGSEAIVYGLTSQQTPVNGDNVMGTKSVETNCTTIPNLEPDALPIGELGG